MLISNEYIKLNEQLHAENNFGISGHKWAPVVEWLIQNYGIKDILDYGAGQQTLKKNLAHIKEVNVKAYDPAIPELAIDPTPSELVTCTDVLEHIEPELIDNVLKHIASISTQIIFLVIPTGPASKFLADGRNAHLIQKPISWWLLKILENFNLISLNNFTEDIVLVLSSKKKGSKINESISETLVNLSKKSRITSATFDGYHLKVSIKPRSFFSRFLPRALSLLLGCKKIGLSERLKSNESIPHIYLTIH
jgi:hypothetical protein